MHFQAHHIGPEVLPRLTPDDLIGLGITSIGHRRKLMDAIAVLDQGRAPAPLARALHQRRHDRAGRAAGAARGRGHLRRHRYRGLSGSRRRPPR
jgi:hypothetical protein